MSLDNPLAGSRTCMVDLETLDTVPSAQILSIGAVCVEDPKINFYEELNENTQYRRTSSLETEEWWCLQKGRPKGTAPLKETLLKFAAWYTENKFTEIWCKGLDFDIPILVHAMTEQDIAIPWEFWDVRCLRTLIKFFPVPAPYVNVIPHHALADAAHQAAQLRAIRDYVFKLPRP